MATPSILIVPDRYKSGVLYSQLPESGAVDFDVTRATTAYRTNASGVLESVASGVPRLDYPVAGGCPSLLIEPAATNLILRSQELDTSPWASGATVVITANTTLAPDGTMTADFLAGNGVVGTKNLNAGAVSITSGTVYAMSCFARAGTFSLLQIAAGSTSFGTNQFANFNLSNGQVTLQSSGLLSAGILPAPNGFFFCWIVATATATATAVPVVYALCETPTSGRLPSFATSNGLSLWGAQLETGAVATSYIPTTSATVTRNADVISKSGVSGFIGQTEGTIYAEVDVRNFQANDRIFAISDGTSDNKIALIKGSNSTLRGLVTTAALTVADIGTASGTTAGVYKIALAYAADDFVLYVNGSQIGTDTSGAVPACSQIFLGKIETSATTNQLNDRIRAAALYTTRLSNLELAALTTL